MQRVLISESGPEFSRLVYGTWRFLDDPSSCSPEQVLERIKVCLDLGITTLDTAEIYGLYKVEELVGKALALDSGGGVVSVTQASFSGDMPIVRGGRGRA